MREPPLLHGSVVDSGVVVLLTPVYEASADAGSFTLREEATSSRHSPAALSSASWGSASRVWRSPTLHIGSFVVTPSTQRLVSGMLLVPAVMISIWYAPQEAVMLLGSIATTVASYEFAWLAFRFARRVERLFSYYEQPARSVQEEQRSIHLSRGNSDSEEGSWSFSSGDVDPHAGVVAPIAGVLFYRGNQWLAALVLALPTSMILVGIDGKVLDLVRPTDHNLETFVWAYLVPTRYVAALCGWFAPSWSWTVLILWQSEVFSVMAVLVQSCPIAVFTCTSTANSNYLFTVFVVGCVAMLLFCASTSSDRMLVVHAALAVTGFVFVHGLGLSMVSLLDVSDLERSRAILTLLLTIFWSAQTSAYAWKRLAAPLWGHSTPLCSRVSTQLFDTESLLVAGGVAVCVTILALHFNSLPGENAGVYSLLAAVGVVYMHAGELVLELWARAVGVRHTGRSLPGSHGSLERTTALTFAFSVFIPYLAAQSAAILETG